MAIPQGILIIKPVNQEHMLDDVELEQIRKQIVRNIESGALPMVLQSNSMYDFEYLSIADPVAPEPEGVPTKQPRKTRASKKPVPLKEGNE